MDQKVRCKTEGEEMTDEGYSPEQIKGRAEAMRVYAEGVDELAKSSGDKKDGGWLKGLATGLRETAKMLEYLNRKR